MLPMQDGQYDIFHPIFADKSGWSSQAKNSYSMLKILCMCLTVCIIMYYDLLRKYNIVISALSCNTKLHNHPVLTVMFTYSNICRITIIITNPKIEKYIDWIYTG